MSDQDRGVSNNERVHFRVMICPLCSFVMCWVNPRFPNYCSECGEHIYPQIKSCVTVDDNDSWLKYKT